MEDVRTSPNAVIFFRRRPHFYNWEPGKKDARTSEKSILVYIGTFFNKIRIFLIRILKIKNIENQLDKF